MDTFHMLFSFAYFRFCVWYLMVTQCLKTSDCVKDDFQFSICTDQIVYLQAIYWLIILLPSRGETRISFKKYKPIPSNIQKSEQILHVQCKESLNVIMPHHLKNEVFTHSGKTHLQNISATVFKPEHLMNSHNELKIRQSSAYK